MNSYLLLKLLHIISATILMGTGIGIAFFMFMAYRSRNIAAFAVITRQVVLADWFFTAPAVLIQMTTGMILMQRLNFAHSSPWFMAVMGLFLFVGICWIPVVVIQIRLKKLAALSLTKQQLHPDIKRLMRYWSILGILAFSAMIALFWLMVFKPLPIS